MLPQGEDKRKKLNKYVEQSVQLMREKDTLDEELKNIKEIVKEELEMPVKDFGILVKTRYDKNKQEELKEQIDTALSEDEILKEA